MPHIDTAAIEDGTINSSVKQKATKVRKGTKLTLAEQGWNIPAGTVVPVDYEIGHYPFFVYGELTGGVKIVKFKGGHWRLDSTEYPNFNDLDVLLGMLKLVEDRQFKGKYIGEEQGTITYEGKETEYPVTTIYTSLRELCDYSGKSFGANQVASITKSIHRLALFSATRITDTGSRRMFSFMLPYEIEKVGKRDKVKLRFSKDFLDHCREINRMLLHWRSIQEMNTQLEKGLFLYLEMNKHACVTERRLLKFLGVTAPVKPQESASKKDWSIYEIENTSYLNRKKKIVHDLINETMPSMAECGRLKGFDKKKHVGISKKGSRYFLLLKDSYYGMIFSKPS